MCACVCWGGVESEPPSPPPPLCGPQGVSVPSALAGVNLIFYTFPRFLSSVLLRILPPGATSPKKQLLPLAFLTVFLNPTDKRRSFELRMYFFKCPIRPMVLVSVENMRKLLGPKAGGE